MKKYIVFILLTFFWMASCAPKPMYATKSGKKKQKYLNMHQYNQNNRDEVMVKEMRNPKKKKSKKKIRTYTFYGYH